MNDSTYTILFLDTETTGLVFANKTAHALDVLVLRGALHMQGKSVHAGASCTASVIAPRM